MTRKRQSTAWTSRSIGRSSSSPGHGIASSTNGAELRTSSVSGRSSAPSQASSLTTQESATINNSHDFCQTAGPTPFWDEEPGTDSPDGVPEPPVPSSQSSYLDRPPHLDLPERPATLRKHSSVPCTVVKLTNLPRYASKDDVKIAVAKELHADRFVTEEERARRIARRMNVGLVNFEICMEDRYSSAQNMGYAFVLLPHGYHGWRLQERGVTMDDQPLRVIPVPGHEPTTSKRLFLQKTPYQDPSILFAQEKRRRALAGDIRLRRVELGALQKDPSRVFSPEWSQ